MSVLARCRRPTPRKFPAEDWHPVADDHGPDTSRLMRLLHAAVAELLRVPLAGSAGQEVLVLAGLDYDDWKRRGRRDVQSYISRAPP